jgi:hypothetical protein
VEAEWHRFDGVVVVVVVVVVGAAVVDYGQPDDNIFGV